MLSRYTQTALPPCKAHLRGSYPTTFGRKRPLAAVILDVLNIRTPRAICGYLDSTVRDELKIAPACADIAALPLSFRALWLRTDRMYIFAERSGGPVLESKAKVPDVDPAQELCRFLGLASRCYEEFRLFAGREHSEVTIMAEYDLVDGADGHANDSDVSDTFRSARVRYSSLQVLASAMQQSADDHDLAVSMSIDATYVHVVRVRPRSVP